MSEMDPKLKQELIGAGAAVGTSLLGRLADWLKGRPAAWKARREARRAKGGVSGKR